MSATQQTVPALSSEKGTLTRHRRPLHALTGLRFFAASWVVLHHTRAFYFLEGSGHPFLGNFFANGNLAVPLFFLLSGFILAYTYRDQIETPGGRLRFWEARFARIWPGYVFSLLAASLVNHHVPRPTLAIASLFMVQGWNPWHIRYAGVWNAVCWTLTVEAFFYLVFPWFQVWAEKLKLRGLWLWMLLAFLVSLAFNTAPMEMGHAGSFPFLWHVPLPVTHLPEFLLGVALGNLFLERDAERPQRNRGLLTYGSLILGIAILVFPVDRWTSAVMLAFALLVYGLAVERTLVSRFLSTRVLILGGGISYSMYLLQTSVRSVIDPLFAGSGHAIIGKLVLFAGLIAVSLLVFLFLEEPARKFLRNKFAVADRKRRASRPTPSSPHSAR